MLQWNTVGDDGGRWLSVMWTLLFPAVQAGASFVFWRSGSLQALTQLIHT